jgi:hypothetical protein
MALLGAIPGSGDFTRISRRANCDSLGMTFRNVSILIGLHELPALIKGNAGVFSGQRPPASSCTSLVRGCRPRVLVAPPVSMGGAALSCPLRGRATLPGPRACACRPLPSPPGSGRRYPPGRPGRRRGEARAVAPNTTSSADGPTSRRPCGGPPSCA